MSEMVIPKDAGVTCEVCGLNTVRSFDPDVNLSIPPSRWYEDRCLCGWKKHGLHVSMMPREESFAEAFERLNPGIKVPRKEGSKTLDEMIVSYAETEAP